MSDNETPLQSWFYDLPEIDGKFYLAAPNARKDDFLVRIGSISIQNQDYFLVESIGKDNILGLLVFFNLFTGKFPGENIFGYSNGIIPFLVNFKIGIDYFLFKEGLKKTSLTVRYTPAMLIYQSRRIDFWYFL